MGNGEGSLRQAVIGKRCIRIHLDATELIAAPHQAADLRAAVHRRSPALYKVKIVYSRPNTRSKTCVALYTKSRRPTDA
jgi:hypothetical protein